MSSVEAGGGVPTPSLAPPPRLPPVGNRSELPRLDPEVHSGMKSVVPLPVGFAWITEDCAAPATVGPAATPDVATPEVATIVVPPPLSKLVEGRAFEAANCCVVTYEE